MKNSLAFAARTERKRTKLASVDEQLHEETGEGVLIMSSGRREG